MQPKIALIMMLKNEQHRLHVTLNSVIGYVDHIIVYDTGSTDNTLNILNTFSKTHNIPLSVKSGEFENFAQSRNVELEFGDEVALEHNIDFLFLMDCNDELHGGKELRDFCASQLSTQETAWMVCQEWFSGACNKYFNIRLIRPNKQWRYRGVVHEWIQKQDEKDIYITHKVGGVVIFQDRTKDDDKTGKRFLRDRELLLEEFKKNPDDARTVFYLAQTCGCLELKYEAYEYYALRATMGGFAEEVFHSYLRLGDLVAESSDPPTFDCEKIWGLALAYYMRAFEHTPRAEPMVAIGHHYKSKKKWLLAYHFAKIACELDFPNECILFVDNHAYEYERYHLLGIVAFYAGRFNEGRDACIKAISVANQQIDKDNLIFYEKVLHPNRSFIFR